MKYETTFRKLTKRANYNKQGYLIGYQIGIDGVFSDWHRVTRMTRKLWGMGFESTPKDLDVNWKEIK